MAKLIKWIYRLLKRIELRRRHIFIDSNVLFNTASKFGGWNKVHEGSCVSNTEIGTFSFIGQNCYLPNAKIGKFCSLGNNIHVVSETHPSRGFISTHPAFFSTNCQCGTTFVKDNLFDEHLTVDDFACIIGNDVWIGDDVRILGGITIGDGAIVGLGALVTKNVPPYAIVGGVPAKIIRYRFDDSKIAELIELKWWNKNIEWIKNNIVICKL